jgi:hypothetical protein
MSEQRYHEIMCPTLTKKGPCNCATHVVVTDPLTEALALARRATNGWACYAKREIEHREIASLHQEISKLAAAVRAGGVPRPQFNKNEGTGDMVCEHGTAADVHCCNCHSGFIFDKDHVCPPEDTSPAAALRAYIDWCGGVHDEHCPEDDTCDCSGKWINSGLNEALRILAAVRAGGVSPPADLLELFGELELALYGKRGNTWEVGRSERVMAVLRKAAVRAGGVSDSTKEQS